MVRSHITFIALVACTHEPSSPRDASTVGVDATSSDGTTSSCSTIFQTGCNPGYKCTITDHVTSSVGCRAAGSLVEGAECLDNDDQCASGLICRSSVCRAFCDRSIPDGIGACMAGLCGDGEPAYCSETCSPLIDTCPQGTECFYPLGAGSPGCLTPGAKSEGDSCNARRIQS